MLKTCHKLFKNKSVIILLFLKELKMTQRFKKNMNNAWVLKNILCLMLCKKAEIGYT